MQRHPVKSSFLAEIGYDSQSEILEVAFKSGRVYQYMGVLPETHKALISAESIGRYFSLAITSKYEQRRARELEPKDEAEPQKDLAL